MNPGIFIKLKTEVILFHGVVSANNESKRGKMEPPYNYSNCLIIRGMINEKRDNQ